MHAELIGPGYVEKCDVCIELTFHPRGRGTRSSPNRSNVVIHSPCDLHADNARRVRSRGCSIDAPLVKLYLAYTRNQLKDYKKKGNIQLPPSGPCDIFRTHIIRKTAYLFAIFGMLRQYGGELHNLHNFLMTGIMDSARHACIKNVQYYSRDACATSGTGLRKPGPKMMYRIGEAYIFWTQT
jgi:hypothetical protein